MTSCGSNTYGQLGVPGDTMGPIVIPRSVNHMTVLINIMDVSRKVFGGHRILEVAAGLRHSIAVTGSGTAILYNV